MQIQWACPDIVLPWKETHDKLSLNPVKETLPSYSGASEVAPGYSLEEEEEDVTPRPQAPFCRWPLTALQLIALQN